MTSSNQSLGNTAVLAMGRLGSVCMLVNVVVAAGARTVITPGVWPVSLEFLQGCDNETFADFVGPLMKMTKLTYTATWGTYHRTKDENATVTGWQRPGHESNPEQGGMRALTFIQPDSKRGVIAFRGTDLNSSGVSGQADACANKVLAHQPLPEWCSQFSNETLDYFGDALKFAAEAAMLYPELEWLFTGHSLGAFLAEAVAVVRQELALSFSAPPVDPVLLNRTKVNVSAVAPWQALSLYNEWDPLRWLARGQLPGSVACYWHVDAPTGCSECDLATGGVDLPSAICQQCFLQTHVFKIYLDLFYSGQRPQCGKWVEAHVEEI